MTPESDALYHVTLNTGHGRWSPRSEVSDRWAEGLGWHARAALRGPAPVPPPLDGWTLEGQVAGGGWFGTLFAPRRVPYATLAIVPREEDVPEVWRYLRNALIAGWPMRTYTPREVPPDPGHPGPWLLALLQPSSLLVEPHFSGIVADYERCLAWAWLGQGETP